MATTANSKTLDGIVGSSLAVRGLKEEIARVAIADAKILIYGETGTGKELVANAIHELSPRASHPFVPVNCAGIPETLLESELFGHVKGSFTGAYRDKPGKLEVAHEGTVFLDEVSEMIPRMQAVLLRFLATGETQRVGASKPTKKVDVRIIAATNRDLTKMISEGSFRKDLYYRMNVVPIKIPPLREHNNDIPGIINKINRSYAHLRQYRLLCFDDEAMAAMINYPWPGNIRQLKNVIERILVTSSRLQIRYADLPLDIRMPYGETAGLSNANASPHNAPLPLHRDVLYYRIRKGESFWEVVQKPFISHDLTRDDVRAIVRKGLEEAGGKYNQVVRLFNIEPRDYRKFMGFLYKFDCKVSKFDCKV